MQEVGRDSYMGWWPNGQRRHNQHNSLLNTKAQNFLKFISALSLCDNRHFSHNKRHTYKNRQLQIEILLSISNL